MKKEILVVGEGFQSSYEEHIRKYPTMVGIVQQFDEGHETINFLRPNNTQIRFSPEHSLIRRIS